MGKRARKQETQEGDIKREIGRWTKYANDVPALEDAEITKSEVGRETSKKGKEVNKE